MKKAFVFPGQGSQKSGMGKALADAFPEARAVFEEVDEALSLKLSTLMFEGAEEELKQTENAQPALMAVSMAVVRVILKQSGKKIGHLADFVAGHSLGEYAALCAAESLSLETCARLLRARGMAMRDAVPAGTGGMIALLGADIEAARDIAAHAAQDEVCSAANDNAQGQVVLSGHMAALERAMVLAAEKGFKKSVKLPVSAPFHCALMQPAADAMRTILERTLLRVPVVPVISNVTAQATQDPEEIRALLVEQIKGSVRWRESVLFMKGQGVETLVECGCGTVLTGLARRIDKELSAISISTPEDVETFLKTL